MTGETLAGHIRRLRLERAAWRLKLGRAPVVEIAFEAGYETQESFTRAFHAAFGVAPGQFRRRQGVSAVIKARVGRPLRGRKQPQNFRAAQMKGKPMNVIVKHIKPMRVAFMRHVGPYNEVGRTWERLMMVLGKDGWLGGGSQCLGLCHDDPAVTPPDKIRYDACVTVDEEFRAAGEIGMQVMRGGVRGHDAFRPL